MRLYDREEEVLNDGKTGVCTVSSFRMESHCGAVTATISLVLVISSARMPGETHSDGAWERDEGMRAAENSGMRGKARYHSMSRTRGRDESIQAFAFGVMMALRISLLREFALTAGLAMLPVLAKERQGNHSERV